MAKLTVPYDLAYMEPGWLCARGPAEAMRALRAWPGAQSMMGYTRVPASRAAFMAIEALAATASVSEGYKTARREHMGVSLAAQADVDQALNYPVPCRVNLLPHQLEFCALAWGQRGMLNASEQGTGKTVMALAMAKLWCCERVLILCPASLVDQWLAELERMWPGSRHDWSEYGLGTGSKAQRTDLLLEIARDSSPLVVINYEVVEPMLEDLVDFSPDLLVCDESWRLKNPKAKVTAAATQLADQCGHTMLLAGTPIGQKAADLYSQLRIVDPVAVAGFSYEDFCQRFCRMEPVRIAGRQTTRPRGVQDAAGLMHLVSDYWYRATKATCLELPPQQEERVYLDLTEGTMRKYRQVAEEGEAALGNELSLAGEQVIQLRLAQLAGGHRPTWREHTRSWQMVSLDTCPKKRWLLDFYHDRLDDDPTVRAIVWCHFKHEAETIHELLASFLDEQAVLIHGDSRLRDGELEAIKASFNSRDEAGVRVIVCTLDKLFAGHNLQAADWNVYFSLPWAHIVHAQSRDRSHRMGREGAVHYVYLLANGTIDIDVMRALDAHQDLTELIAPDTVGCPTATTAGS